MIVGAMELNIGDPISYARYPHGHKKKPQQLSGTIKSIDGQHIAVQLKNYRDCISIKDLSDKTVVIEGMSGIKLQTDEVNAPFRKIASDETAGKIEKPVRDKEKKTTKYIISNWPEVIKQGIAYIETEGLGSYQVAKLVKKEFNLPVCVSTINTKLRQAYIKRYGISPPRAEHRQDGEG